MTSLIVIRTYVRLTHQRLDNAINAEIVCHMSTSNGCVGQ